MVRYPHTLEVSYREEGSFNEAGDYTVGTAVSVSIEGRAEANGKGNLVRLEDGSQIVYDWMFYAEHMDDRIPYNADAELKEGDTSFWTGNVKRMAKRQRGTQIWL